VRAVRSGGWWALDIDGAGVRAFSQVKRLDQAVQSVREVVALVDDLEPDEVSPDDIEIVPDLEGLPAERLREVRALRQRAEQISAEASRASRCMAHDLRALGLSHRDIGSLLEISHQGASHLLKAG